MWSKLQFQRREKDVVESHWPIQFHLFCADDFETEVIYSRMVIFYSCTNFNCYSCEQINQHPWWHTKTKVKITLETLMVRMRQNIRGKNQHTYCWSRSGKNETINNERMNPWDTTHILEIKPTRQLPSRWMDPIQLIFYRTHTAQWKYQFLSAPNSTQFE